jgi:hypothetical protein
MRCSECSREIKPVVSVDIDGVLGEYHDHFVNFAQWYTGETLRWDYPGEPLEFSEHLRLRKELYREIKMAYRQGGMKRSMPLRPGARLFMDHLSKIDVEVWIATTRPWQRLDNIDPDTRHWLDRNTLTYEYMIYGEDKYSQLTQLVDRERLIMIVEDEYTQCGRAQDLTDMSTVWQPDSVHTSAMPWPNQFKTFFELTKIIDKKLEEWRKEHATADATGHRTTFGRSYETTEAPNVKVLVNEEGATETSQVASGHVSAEEDPC